MTPERYEQIGQLYHEALELVSEERAAFLERACGSDEELRREVESLVAAHEQAGDFIATPALGSDAGLLGDGEPPSLAEGHRIRHYQIMSLLGAGGMGEVYLAQDTSLGRKVALKLLPRKFTYDPERVRRFELEARAASALNHPNILTIYEIGHADGIEFIAAELIEGETLRSRMAKGRMPLPEALDVAAQVASALAVAHAAGVVHRDVKPENVMVRPDGIVKVLDFGLTKLTEKAEPVAPNRSAGSGAWPAMSDHTEAGLMMGTVRYMSPEQTRDSSHVDHRTDIWSLGVVLYEMVTGRAPFEGEDARQRVISIQKSEPPPLAAYVEGTPERLEEIVRKALAKEPGERYQAAGDMLNDLRSLKRRIELDEELVRSGSHERAGAGVVVGGLKTRRRGLSIALVVLTLLTAGGAFGVYRWLGQDRPINKPSSPATKIVPFTSFPGVETEPNFSPDGRQLAFAWNGPGGDNYDIYVKLLDAGAPLRLTSHPGEDRSPCWSPDGRHIAFIRYSENENALVIVPVTGGPERILHKVISPGRRSLELSLSWSADGKSLAFSERDSPLAPFQIHLLSVESLESRRLTSPPAGTPGDRLPAISPDGKRLAFTRQGSNEADDIYLAPVSGGEPMRLTSDSSLITGLAWTPDGREIIYSSNRAGALHLWKVSATGGKSERVPAGEESPDTLAISRQGKLLAYTSTLSDTNIWRIEAQSAKGAGSGPPLKLISSTRSDGSPQYSPDGKKIVFSSSRTGTLELWTCDADGANPVQLTSFGGPHVGTPRWSPDGRQLAFDAITEDRRDIYVVGVDGGKPRRMTTEASVDVRPSWSRDGRFVYFGSDRSGEWQVWKSPAEGGPAVQVTKESGREAFESPDGRFIYYAKDENEPGLWRVPAEGGEEEKVLDRVRQGAWAMWERGIYFVNSETHQRPSIEFHDFATGRTVRIGTIEKELYVGGPNLAATPDGRWILYVQVDQTESDIMLVENFS